ncbi:hypothetical protein SAMN04489807_0022 [Microbacterium hydrocarbonoxydans]|uniref:Uncharacterized protein n=1 Tax=Microbacterium hydrocarbonoxydans TaxID=273678 RepID=A0A1H4I3V6_9MICO|nr:hypothetical protein SAMN04489807_0022 [Microbacterium hydrocarbonoxydans]
MRRQEVGNLVMPARTTPGESCCQLPRRGSCPRRQQAACNGHDATPTTIRPRGSHGCCGRKVPDSASRALPTQPRFHRTAVAQTCRCVPLASRLERRRSRPTSAIGNPARASDPPSASERRTPRKWLRPHLCYLPAEIEPHQLVALELRLTPYVATGATPEVLRPREKVACALRYSNLHRVDDRPIQTAETSVDRCERDAIRVAGCGTMIARHPVQLRALRESSPCDQPCNLSWLHHHSKEGGVPE